MNTATFKKKKNPKFVGTKTNGSLIKGEGGEYWLWMWMWMVDLDLVWVLNPFAYGWLLMDVVVAMGSVSSHT